MRKHATIDEARQARTKAPGIFRPLVGEVAVGLVRLQADSYGLKVNLGAAPPEGVSLPDEIDGVPLQVDVIGKIRKR